MLRVVSRNIVRVVQPQLSRKKCELSTNTVSQPLTDFLKDMKDGLQNSQKEAERRMEISQKEHRAELLAAQTAAERRMEISQKEYKEGLLAAQSAAERRMEISKAELQASQKELKEDTQRMMIANNYKLATMVVTAIIGGIALFESVGGAIQYPWRKIRQGSNS